MDDVKEIAAGPEEPMRATPARRALDAGRMAWWQWNIRSRTVTGDSLYAQLLGLEPGGQPWDEDPAFAAIDPNDLPELMKVVDRHFRGETPHYEAYFRVSPDEGGRDLWCGGRGSVVERDDDGNPTEMIGVLWDATVEKERQQRLEILASEMDHRVKNAFSVMRGLIRLGARLPGEKEDFAATLQAQVQALADAHAVSARIAQDEGSPWSVSVEELVQSALAGFQGGGSRVVVKITPGLEISQKNVSPFCMMVYELSTNALKHGGLNDPQGQLGLTIEKDDDDQIVFDWDETAIQAGDHPNSGVPGFGVLLLQHCVSALGGQLTQDFRDSGLRFRVVFPA